MGRVFWAIVMTLPSQRFPPPSPSPPIVPPALCEEAEERRGLEVAPVSGPKRRRLSPAGVGDVEAVRADDAVPPVCALWDLGSWACASPESVSRKTAVYGRPDPWRSAACAADPDPAGAVEPTEYTVAGTKAPVVSVVQGASSGSEVSRGGSGCLFIERNSASLAAPAEASAPLVDIAGAEPDVEVPETKPSASTSSGPAAGGSSGPSATGEAPAREIGGASSSRRDDTRSLGTPLPGTPRGLKRGSSEDAGRRVAPRGGSPPAVSSELAEGAVPRQPPPAARGGTGSSINSCAEAQERMAETFGENWRGRFHRTHRLSLAAPLTDCRRCIVASPRWRAAGGWPHDSTMHESRSPPGAGLNHS